MSVYRPGCRTFSCPWIVSLWELQRVRGMRTWKHNWNLSLKWNWGVQIKDPARACTKISPVFCWHYVTLCDHLFCLRHQECNRHIHNNFLNRFKSKLSRQTRKHQEISPWKGKGMWMHLERSEFINNPWHFKCKMSTSTRWATMATYSVGPLCRGEHTQASKHNDAYYGQTSFVSSRTENV